MKEKLKKWLERFQIKFGLKKPTNSRKVEDDVFNIQRKKSQIPLRLNILFFIIFTLFVLLIIQLGYLQIANGDQFKETIEQSEKLTVTGNTPRGEIYDVNGTPMVANQGNQAILYTKSGDIPVKDMRQVADKLNSLIAVTPDRLSKRDKADYWLAETKNMEEARKRLSDEETKDKNGEYIGESKVYSLIVDKLTDEELNFDEHTLAAASIYKRVNGVSTLNSVFIKNQEVTEEEIAVVSENIIDLPGISTGTDWQREYPQGDTLRSILGTVTSEKTGLPAEELEYYLAKGYARNDRVGQSYLEKQFEPILRGTKSQNRIILDRKTNEIQSQVTTYNGEKGKNLQLTLNVQFQQGVESILRRYYENMVATGKAQYSEGAYVVVTDPKTGEVKAMAGLSHEPGTMELTDDALGTINKAFIPGSVVKPATISAAYEQKLISGNQTLIDEPIQLAQSAMKSSWFNKIVTQKIPMTVTQALERSSNSYMMKIVFLMLNQTYVAGGRINYDPSVFETLRKTYEEYGLGTSTGIDLPGESYGVINKDYSDPSIMGNLLDLSYGNYDTYTPMQLAQFAGTLANNGKRMATHVVKGIYGNDENGNLGDAEQIMEPKELNQVNISQEQMNLIHQGMYDVVHGAQGTGTLLSGAKYDIAGKTGTAETFTPDGKQPLVNSTFIGFAPATDPEVAISVVLPKITNENEHENLLITREVLDLYYDLMNGDSTNTNQ